MADTAAPATPAPRPTLTSVHDSLQQVQRSVLDVIARAQAIGAPSALLSLSVLNSLAQPLTKAVMDMEQLM